MEMAKLNGICDQLVNHHSMTGDPLQCVSNSTCDLKYMNFYSCVMEGYEYNNNNNNKKCIFSF